MKILLLAFNRPELTEEILSRIIEVRPSTLYVAVDGPRHGNSSDIAKCTEVKRIVKCRSNDLDIRLLFREKNFGILYGVQDAIDWFFQHETEGIILEDDCFPDISFFDFCRELLSRYRDNDRIFMISGTNFIPQFQIETSYLFSRLSVTWGWATWKRAWQHFDSSMQNWLPYVKTNDLEYFGKKQELVYDRINREYLDPESRTWGVQWRTCFLVNKGLSIVPRNNLIKNKGFGHRDATRHWKTHRISEVPVEPMKFPLCHPKQILPNRFFDEESLDFYYDEVPFTHNVDASLTQPLKPDL